MNKFLLAVLLAATPASAQVKIFNAQQTDADIEKVNASSGAWQKSGGGSGTTVFLSSGATDSVMIGVGVPGAKLEVDGTGSFSNVVSSGSLISTKSGTGAKVRLENTSVSISPNDALGTIEAFSGDASGGGNTVVGRMVWEQRTTTPVDSIWKLYTGGNTLAMMVNETHGATFTSSMTVQAALNVEGSIQSTGFNLDVVANEITYDNISAGIKFDGGADQGLEILSASGGTILAKFYTSSGWWTKASYPGTHYSSTTFRSGVSMPLVAKTADYTATADDQMITCDATSAAVTITLPAIATSLGRIYHVKKIDASGNNCIIDGNAAENIDGATTSTISTQYNSVSIIAGGTEWHIF